MIPWLLVTLGAGVGSGARYAAGTRLDARWPHGTLLVNLAGSFLLGLLTGLALSDDLLLLLGTGFCGGLTTFSSWMVQSVDRGPRLGSAYVVTTLVGALALCWLGFVLAA